MWIILDMTWSYLKPLEALYLRKLILCSLSSLSNTYLLSFTLMWHESAATLHTLLSSIFTIMTFRWPVPYLFFVVPGFISSNKQHQNKGQSIWIHSNLTYVYLRQAEAVYSAQMLTKHWNSIFFPIWIHHYSAVLDLCAVQCCYDIIHPVHLNSSISIVSVNAME